MTSGISIVEGPCASLVERLKMSRIKACAILFFVISLIAIPASLSFGILADIKLFDKTIFDFLDYLTSNIMLPLNTLLLCLISGWYLKFDANKIIKNKICALLFNMGLRYVVPIALICLMLIGL